MKTILSVLGFSLLILTSCNNTKTVEKDFIQDNIDNAAAQNTIQTDIIEKSGRVLNPRTIDKDGNIVYIPIDDWCSGFYPGSIWLTYELTGDKKWLPLAVKYTEALDSVKHLKWHHDVGFMIGCSYLNGYRLADKKEYKDVIVETARSLSTRFRPNAGVIQSWDADKGWQGTRGWKCPVIIDNMMNLELLYFASKVTGDTRYAKIATTHAETTAKNQLREDYSNYHVVDYDTLTGKVLHQATCQGFSDNSAWARGQAWAIYGYTMAYRETKNPNFLEIAVHTADYWLNHPNLPEDGVPYWDFNAGQEGYVPDWKYDPDRFKVVPRDASAAAIAASAFLELATYVPNEDTYYDAAVKILKSLSSPAYRAVPGTNNNFILMHSVGSIPHGQEIDVPLVYADYYFLEALNRYEHYNSKK